MKGSIERERPPKTEKNIMHGRHGLLSLFMWDNESATPLTLPNTCFSGIQLSKLKQNNV